MSEHGAYRCPICQLEHCDCPEDSVREAQARIDAGGEPLVDASNPAQVAARARDKRKVENSTKDDMNWLMRHPQGRRIMWGLLERCSIFQNAYQRGGGDTNAVMFNCGEANVGLGYLKDVISQEPDGYNLMVKENSGRME